MPLHTDHSIFCQENLYKKATLLLFARYLDLSAVNDPQVKIGDEKGYTKRT